MSGNHSEDCACAQAQLLHQVGRLAHLMTRYSRQPSPLTALNVVRVLEHLLVSPEVRSDRETSGIYRCLLNQWRALYSQTARGSESAQQAPTIH